MTLICRKINTQLPLSGVSSRALAASSPHRDTEVVVQNGNPLPGRQRMQGSFECRHGRYPAADRAVHLDERPHRIDRTSLRTPPRFAAWSAVNARSQLRADPRDRTGDACARRRRATPAAHPRTRRPWSAAQPGATSRTSAARPPGRASRPVGQT